MTLRVYIDGVEVTKGQYEIGMDDPLVQTAPPCPCGCDEFEPGGCPIPAPGVDAQWCVNLDCPDWGCRCIALVSQGLCEGCYVATK